MTRDWVPLVEFLGFLALVIRECERYQTTLPQEWNAAAAVIGDHARVAMAAWMDELLRQDEEQREAPP